MSSENPFVGIRPFLETDFDRFHGRDPVSASLINRIKNYDITILIGPSGFGKSSLVNCGVVKPMKKERLEQEDGIARQPFVVRDWGKLRGDTVGDETIGSQFARILEHHAHQAFDLDAAEGMKAADRIEAERSAFLAIIEETKKKLTTNPYAFIELVQNLSRAFNGIVLVFDQFEEILRVSKDVQVEVSNLVVEIAKVPGVKVMLSLRKEYKEALRFIEANAGRLALSTIHLEGMSFDYAKKVFVQMARGHGETPDVDLKEELLEVLRLQDGGEVDLFYYQAILSQIWKALNDSGQSTKVMDKSSLKVLGDEVVAHPMKAFDYALLRIVNGCFPTDKDDRNETLRCRSHAIRVAPWLSSGGFKTTQRQDILFEKAYGEAMRSAVGKEPKEITSGSFQNDHGLKLEKYEHVQAMLNQEYVATLERLAKGNILKHYAREDHWELTHDRLGDPLYAWSRDQMNRISDNRSASLASRGVTPIRVDKHQSTNKAHESETFELSAPSDWRKLNWCGCSVEPDRNLTSDRAGAKPRARFREIDFDKCDFRGSVFKNCAFESCSFVACHLGGVAFIDCTFNACQFRELTDVRGASIGFFGCTFENGVTFSDCDLIQFTIAGKDTKIDASGIVFQRCTLHSSRFSSDQDSKSMGRIRLEEMKEVVDYDLNWFDDKSKWLAG